MPNYIFIYLLSYIYIFLNSDKILSYLDHIQLKGSLIIGISVILTIIILFYFNIPNAYTAKWCGLISAFFVFTIFVKIFKNSSSNIVVDFISSISFEIYLVHHIFCFGEFSIYKIIANPIIGTMAIILLSILLASFLHFISNCIKHIFEKK